MWIFAFRRILYAVPIAVCVSIICFSLVYLAPGDPLASLISADASEADIAALRHAYGLDRAAPVQYLNWLSKVASGDLGKSIQNGQPVTDAIVHALSNTLFVTLWASAIAFSLAFVFGTLAAYHRGRWIDRGATWMAIAGVSVPNYWFALVLVSIFAINLGLLPATGMGSRGSQGFSMFEWSQFRYAVLPICAMTLVPFGVVMRSTRSAVGDVLSQEFVSALRAKGLEETVILRHVVRNALPQVLAVMGLQFGYLVGGSILIETIFAWPGTGFLLGKAILARDIPVVQGTVLVLALFFIATNLVVDLLQTSVDPRIRRR